jgi:hypothetical protein
MGFLRYFLFRIAGLWRKKGKIVLLLLGPFSIGSKCGLTMDRVLPINLHNFGCL